MAVSKRVRYEVLRRDGHTCRYCGAKAPDVTLTVDHVVPVALGGSDDPSNLVTACGPCNSGKTSTTPDAPLVAQVADDALRWAAAMRVAIDSELIAHSNRETYRNTFLKAWKARDKRATLLDPAWISSLTVWHDSGVPIQLVTEALNIAWSREKVADTDVFRYMAGIVWRRVEKMQADAKESLTTETAGRERCGHCVGCQYAAENPGNTDGYDGKLFSDCRRWKPGDDEDETCSVCERSDCVYADGWHAGESKGWDRCYASAEAAYGPLRGKPDGWKCECPHPLGVAPDHQHPSDCGAFIDGVQISNFVAAMAHAAGTPINPAAYAPPGYGNDWSDERKDRNARRCAEWAALFAHREPEPDVSGDDAGDDEQRTE